MRILCVHNYYLWSGGEDRVFEQEVELLRRHGHRVLTYIRHNRDIAAAGRLRTARDTWWNPRSYRELGQLIERERPDVMHCTNTFPLISPSAYYAARAHNVPVIQSLHNFRLICPDSTLFRQDRLCRQCLGKTVAWPGVVYGCYRDSRLGTAVVAGMQSLHRLAGTWQRQVSTFVAVSDYVREVVCNSGLTLAPVVVKPNFVLCDPGVGSGDGGYYLFVGRLCAEKGVGCLLQTFARGSRPLKIVGSGPLEGQVRKAVAAHPQLDYLGQLGAQEIQALMQRAVAVVVPSQFPEPFGLVVAEAFSCGTPVLAAASGALPDWVKPGHNGYLFSPGDGASLEQALEQLEHGPCLRDQARSSYCERFGADDNYRQLIDIYRQALARPR